MSTDHRPQQKIRFRIPGIRYCYSARSKRFHDCVVVLGEQFPHGKQFDFSSKKLCRSQIARRPTIQLKLDWCISDVNWLLIVANNVLAYSKSLATSTLITSLSFTERKVRQYSTSSPSLSDSTTFTLVLVKDWDAKWFILPQTEQLFPGGGRLLLAARCFALKNLHLNTSFWLESSTSQSSFSRLLLAELLRPLLTDTLPSFVCSFNEFTASPSFKVLVRVFNNSAALQRLRHLCKSGSGILSSSSRSCLSWMPQNDPVSHQRIFKIPEVTGRR